MIDLKVPMTLHLTRHASARMQQRGARQHDIWLLAQFTDQETNGRADCRICTLSRRSAAELREAGYSQQVIDRLCRKRLVMNGSTVVTVTDRQRKTRWN